MPLEKVATGYYSIKIINIYHFMSENETKVDELEDLGTDPADDETTDWKAEALKARGIAKRNATRLAKLKEAKAETNQAPKKDNTNKPSFDYGKAVFLESKGVIEPEDIAWVEKQADETGKNIYELFQYKWFKEEVKERKLSRESQNAIPEGTKRAGQNSRDSVDYWVAKGELPKDNPELRSKVLQARIEVEKRRSMFTDNPIV